MEEVVKKDKMVVTVVHAKMVEIRVVKREAKLEVDAKWCKMGVTMVVIKMVKVVPMPAVKRVVEMGAKMVTEEMAIMRKAGMNLTL